MRVLLTLLSVLCIIAISGVSGYHYAKKEYTKPFFITLQKLGESELKISPMRLCKDSIAIDSLYHSGRLQTSTTWYYTFEINPIKYK